MVFRGQGRLFRIPNDLLRLEPNPIVHTHKVFCPVLISISFPRTVKMEGQYPFVLFGTWL